MHTQLHTTCIYVSNLYAHKYIHNYNGNKIMRHSLLIEATYLIIDRDSTFHFIYNTFLSQIFLTVNILQT